MRYVALEEAFSIPELAGHQPPPWTGLAMKRDYLQDWACKLPDFTEYRLPEMDEAGIDIQVLSLTVPVSRPTSTRPPPATTPGGQTTTWPESSQHIRTGWSALEELAVEVGGHALRVVFGGVFDRHPGATLILGHMGEFLPFMRSRLEAVDGLSAPRSATPTGRRSPTSMTGGFSVCNQRGTPPARPGRKELAKTALRRRPPSGQASGRFPPRASPTTSLTAP